MTDMAERVKKWANRNLWCIVGKDMQKEVINSRNIILALVEVAENLQAQYYISCPACDDNLKYSSDALTTCEARIAEVLKGNDICEQCRKKLFKNDMEDTVVGWATDYCECLKPSTYYHSDPATKGVEKRTLGED